MLSLQLLAALRQNFTRTSFLHNFLWIRSNMQGDVQLRPRTDCHRDRYPRRRRLKNHPEGLITREDIRQVCAGVVLIIKDSITTSFEGESKRGLNGQ